MKQKLILLLISMIVIFSLTEITFNIIVDKDLDGNLSLGYVHLKPYHLPINETKKKIDELQSHLLPDSLKELYNGEFRRRYFNVRLIPDPVLGWSPNPYFKSKEGLYLYNKDGIRSQNILTDYSNKKKFRIAIYGDSYSHGDEVPFENTIGYYLQNKFDSLKMNIEVINMGVSGYGTDQAFIRWKETREMVKPDIVILGVQFENAKRNVNLLRPFYYFITNIPYSKPRFVIQGNKLQLIKNPVPNIFNTVNIIKNFPKWDFAHFEYFYSKEFYEPAFLFYSKSISFISSAISQIFDEIDFYEPQCESYQVTYKLIDKFKNDVENNGKVFVPVHLPVRNDFDFLTGKFVNIMYNQKFIYDELFEALKLKMNFVEPYKSLAKWGDKNGKDKLFMKRHYSPIANKIIAGKIFNFIVAEYSNLINQK